MVGKLNLILALAIASLFVIAGCAQQGTTPGLESMDNTVSSPGSAQLDPSGDLPQIGSSSELPPLPDSRIALGMESEAYSAADVFVAGGGEYEVDPVGGAVYLSAYDTPMTWSVYGIPQAEVADAVDVDLYLDEGQQAWLAVADYELGGWRMVHDAYDGASTLPRIAFDAAFLSPEYQNMYLAVVCPASNFIGVNGFIYALNNAGTHTVELDEVIFKSRYRGAPNPVEVTYVYPGQPAFAYAKGFTCDQGHKALRYNWTITCAGPAKLVDGATTTTYRNRISTVGCTAGQDITVTVSVTCTGGKTSAAISGELEVK